MENTEKKLKQLSKFCNILKNDCIKKDVNDYLNGYVIVDVYKSKNNTYECELENDKKEKIDLHIGIQKFHILKKDDHYVEKIVINDDEKWYQRRLEKRDKGFVVIDITKEYGISKRFNYQTVLTDLTEERHILTNDNMKKMLGIEDIDNQTLVHIFLTMFDKNIKTFSNLTTKFSTHMNYYYIAIDDVREYTDNIYPTRTYFNDNEISYTYDLVDGHDKLYRVHDLYNGIINKRNEHDIKSIHLGLLTKRGFDLKTYEGITEKENSLIGESLIPISDEYKNYLKEFFNNFNHYTEEIMLDRESLLNAIDYFGHLQEKVKKHIEEDLGIPYEEYERMEFDEQLKVNSPTYKILRKIKNIFYKQSK